MFTCCHALPEVTVCVAPLQNSNHHAMHVKFAVSYFARNEFKLIDWKFSYIAPMLPIGVVSTRSILIGWIKDTHNCTIFIGPGFSSSAVSLSAVMREDNWWVDFASTATELSNKLVHPYFNRIIPTDSRAMAALTSMLVAFNWTTINVISSDDAYGLSVST